MPLTMEILNLEMWENLQPDQDLHCLIRFAVSLVFSFECGKERIQMDVLNWNENKWKF